MFPCWFPLYTCIQCPAWFRIKSVRCAFNRYRSVLWKRLLPLTYQFITNWRYVFRWLGDNCSVIHNTVYISSVCRFQRDRGKNFKTQLRIFFAKTDPNGRRKRVSKNVISKDSRHLLSINVSFDFFILNANAKNICIQSLIIVIGTVRVRTRVWWNRITLI